MSAIIARQRALCKKMDRPRDFANNPRRHPDVPTFMTIDSHDCEVKGHHIQHDQAATAEQKARGFDVNSTYYFPNVSMSVA